MFIRFVGIFVNRVRSFIRRKRQKSFRINFLKQLSAAATVSFKSWNFIMNLNSQLLTSRLQQSELFFSLFSFLFFSSSSFSNDGLVSFTRHGSTPSPEVSSARCGFQRKNFKLLHATERLDSILKDLLRHLRLSLAKSCFKTKTELARRIPRLFQLW